MQIKKRSVHQGARIGGCVGVSAFVFAMCCTPLRNYSCAKVQVQQASPFECVVLFQGQPDDDVGCPTAWPRLRLGRAFFSSCSRTCCKTWPRPRHHVVLRNGDRCCSLLHHSLFLSIGALLSVGNIFLCPRVLCSRSRLGRLSTHMSMHPCRFPAD